MENQVVFKYCQQLVMFPWHVLVILLLFMANTCFCLVDLFSVTMMKMLLLSMICTFSAQVRFTQFPHIMSMSFTLSFCFIETYKWEYVGEAGVAPAARGSHSMGIVYDPSLSPENRVSYLVIYGGSSHEGVQNDTVYAELPNVDAIGEQIISFLDVICSFHHQIPPQFSSLGISFLSPQHDQICPKTHFLPVESTDVSFKGRVPTEVAC
jgi:hypothetical protein